MQFSVVNVLALAAAVSAKTISVEVGNNALLFAPNDITAAAGDKIEFTFYAKNHTVTQSTFDKPCKAMDGGFFSGFVPVASGKGASTFVVDIKDDKPIWFFCSQTVKTHCQAGMVGAVNAAKTGNTFDAYTAAAKASNDSTVPADGKVFGGSIVAAAGNGTASVSGGSTTVVVSSSAYTSTGMSTYTSGGVAYTTAYTTTGVATVTSTSVSGGSTVAAGTGAASSTSKAGAAATGVSGGLFAAGAVVLGALAMV